MEEKHNTTSNVRPHLSAAGIIVADYLYCVRVCFLFRVFFFFFEQKPESMVAESLRMKGELEFTRLLRVDGRFEGDLVTDKGSLVVGPKGEVIGDLKNMQVQYW